MELALLVWVISWLNPLGFMLFMSSFVLAIIVTICKVTTIIEKDSEVAEIAKKFMYTKTTIFLIAMSILIPNEKTAQYMAGAYLIQSTYESDFVQKATPLAQQAILNQLRMWAKDNEDLEMLIGQSKIEENSK